MLLQSIEDAHGIDERVLTSKSVCAAEDPVQHRDVIARVNAFRDKHVQEEAVLVAPRRAVDVWKRHPGRCGRDAVSEARRLGPVLDAV